MLHFHSMTIENFGPYKGKQQIVFSDQPGVTIFWGDNGRGKTTLLNAFRYALFGVVQRRNGNLKELSKMQNKEAVKEGEYGFSIKLNMESDGEQYELTRQHVLRKGISTPTTEADYEPKVFLKKNGSILSAEEREHELNVIMPRQVSRFFLFDAELLQEYEELLEVDTSTGDRIKEAIEKILGVPVLQNGVADIESCLSTYEKQRSKAAQKDSKTVQLGNQLEAIEANIAQHESIINTQTSELSEMIKERNSIQDQMDETDKIREWIKERDALRDTVSNEETDLNEVTQQLRGYLKDAWRGMLISRIEQIRKEIETTTSSLEKRKQRRAVADEFIHEIRRAIEDKECPVCKQSVSDELIIQLRQRVEDSKSSYSGLSEEENELLYSLQNRKSVLDGLVADDVRSEVEIVEGRRDKLQIKIAEENQKIHELEERIREMSDVDEEMEIVSLAKKYSSLDTKIQLKKKGIEEEKEKLEEAKKSKESISAAISKQASGVDYKNADLRYTLCNKIFKVFDESKSLYRDHLKGNVEKDATDIFVKLSSDKDYVGLLINENYGLNIKHKSGEIVPGRSAGYEHVVALSLIGALHKNAPLQGPIIMDSPFGRLDPTHKTNIIKALPEMAEQTMLLAYFGEIDEQVARKELAENLRKEYTLTRVGSMHTEIK